MKNLQFDVRQENGVLSLKKIAEVLLTTSCFAYVPEKKKHSAFCFERFSLIFYAFNLNIQGFVCSEIIKYKLSLHIKVQVFAKCSAIIQMFYIQTCPLLSSYIEINRISF